MYFLIVGLIVLITTIADSAPEYDSSAFQLLNYKNETKYPSRLTTLSGSLVPYSDTNALNDNLIMNKFFMDTITHLSREEIPQRVFHAKGTGATGYFEVTHDISHICKAKLFNSIGNKTPVAVRFSTVSSSRGGIDTVRDPRGFSVKFYTEDGNFDIVGLAQPMFFLKDPVIFPSLVHIQKPNPATGFFDFTARWDFRTLRAESLHAVLYLMSDFGIFDGYRYMPGYSIHTYQIENEDGTPYFVRFHILPDAGNRTLTSERAHAIGGTDPDYASRDLYDAIDTGNYPTWTLNVQILSMENLTKVDFNPFDVTRIIPTERFPLHPVGKIVLNKNPKNKFKEVERLAFCPGNVIPGIIGAPDKIFEARVLSYRDTQYYRLGSNFDKISPNCPFHQSTYIRDGLAPVRDNGKDSPNYYPNSFNGPYPFPEINKSQLLRVVDTEAITNFDQANNLFENLTEEQKRRLVNATLSEIKCTPKFIKDRIVKQFENINNDLANRVAYGLAVRLKGINCSKY